MNFSLHLKVDGMRFFRRVEYPKVSLLSIGHQLGGKLAVWPDADAKQARCAPGAGLSSILHVQGVWKITQISNAVVCVVSILMVRFAGRPSTVMVKPSEPMQVVVLAVDLDAHVPIGTSVRHRASRAGPTPLVNSPSENASLWIVVQKFAQALGRQFFHPSILNQLSRAQALI